MPLRRVSVFGDPRADPPAERVEQSAPIGRLLAENGIAVVLGGAAGVASARAVAALAEAARASGGSVIGVHATGEAPPAFCTDLEPVSSALEVRATLARLADAYLGLAGGFDTIAQVFELWDAAAGATEKPVGLLNTGDYYTALLATMDDVALARYVRESQRGLLIVDRNPETLLMAMAEYRAPETRRLDPREAW